MNEEMYYNEFVDEICAGDLNYAIETLQQWLKQIQNEKENILEKAVK